MTKAIAPSANPTASKLNPATAGVTSSPVIDRVSRFTSDTSDDLYGCLALIDALDAQITVMTEQIGSESVSDTQDRLVKAGYVLLMLKSKLEAALERLEDFPSTIKAVH